MNRLWNTVGGRWVGRGRVALLLLAVLTLAGPGGYRHARAAQGSATLTLMHFNDDYQLTPTGSLGGLAYLAGQADAVRAADPQAMLLFAGDMLSPSVESSVFKGTQMLDGFNRLDVTAATLGNHEFDRGDAALTGAIAASRFPWVSSNVTVVASGKPFTGTVVTLTKVVHGVKVGFLGVLTPETSIISSPGHELAIQPVIAAARQAMARLTAAGATVIVALTHETMSDDIALATALPRLDLIVGGHDHVLEDATVGRTLIVKAEADAHYLGVTTLGIGPGGRVASAVDQPMLIDPANTTPNAGVLALVKGYEAQLSKQLNVVLGHTTVALDARETAVRQKESPLGNFIADALRASANTDVALMNGGGIRTDAVYPAGAITRKAILSFLPFGNVLVTERLSGADLKATLENGVSKWKTMGGRFPQVSGLRFTWSPTRPVGQRVSAVTVGGQPLSLTQMYTVATNDYMLGGGDGYKALTRGMVLVGPNGGQLMADVVMAAVQAQGTISPTTDGRITQAP